MTTLTLSSSSSFVHFLSSTALFSARLFDCEHRPTPSLYLLLDSCSPPTLTTQPLRPHPPPSRPQDWLPDKEEIKRKEKNRQSHLLGAPILIPSFLSTTPHPPHRNQRHCWKRCAIRNTERHHHHHWHQCCFVAPVSSQLTVSQLVGARNSGLPFHPFLGGKGKAGDHPRQTDCSRWGRLGIGCRHSVGVSTNKATF